MVTNDEILAELKELRERIEELDAEVGSLGNRLCLTRIDAADIKKRQSDDFQEIALAVNKIWHEIGRVWEHLSPTMNKVFPGIAKVLLTVTNFPNKNSPPDTDPPVPEHLKRN